MTKLKYKVGDKVKIIKSLKSNGEIHPETQHLVGSIITLEEFNIKDEGGLRFMASNGEIYPFNDSEVELIKNGIIKTTMKKLSNFYKKLTSPTVQILVEMGYLNGDLEPTEKAHQAIREIQFFNLQEELIKRATEEKAELEKEVKNN